MMASYRVLSYDESQDLDEWLAKRKLVLNHRTRCTLCDVVNVAKLFKDAVPDLVDLRKYTSHCSVALKLANWRIFNDSVLRKLKISMPDDVLQELAAGQLHAMRLVMFFLMRIEQDRYSMEPLSQELSDVEHELLEQQQEPALEKNGMVTLAKYEELVREVKVMDQYIKSTVQKVEDLENVIRSKDGHIKKLMDQLNTLTVRILSIDNAINEDDY
ncbi:uncharacterized protein LOC108605339 [Drosophila busckii]|uniref:uncharacterized protein LOC108605339 n=1 Tax=Drosophila busckii TaxID=30019 RepID=UPI00083F40D5|nr:uncharacterized protein LOC108605339 [Drosophila busckii]